MDTPSIVMLSVVGVLFILMWTPTFIAYKRKKANRFAIFILNLFLGWTFVGFVVALVWSLTKDPEKPQV
jgi:hypothetical protein